MEVEPDCEFTVQILKKNIVRADNFSAPSHTISLSNLDLLSGRFPVTYFYVYRKPENKDFVSVVKDLKSSLANTLNHYHPFAGRIITNKKTGEPEIVCDNYGAQVVEAYIDFPLVKLEFYNLNEVLGKTLVPLNHDFPLQVQVTRYACNGISITFTFDHVLGDAHAFGNFLRSWCETAQGKPLSCLPIHSRNLQARSPPTYDPLLDETFISCNMEEIVNMPTNDITLKRLYHIDAVDIDRLQTLACTEGTRRTKIEAFSAYVWKVMVTAIDESTTPWCKMGWLVDGRTRMSHKTISMSNYIGNVLSVAVGEANVEDLERKSLSDVANTVHEAIEKVTNESHFLDLIDWVECHRPGLMLAKIVLGRGGTSLVLSSARQFPVAELNFGFGPPLLGTVCSTINKIGTGYMNQRPSARGDGSWVVSAIIWPALAAALESDPEHVFKPMNVNHLGLEMVI